MKFPAVDEEDEREVSDSDIEREISHEIEEKRFFYRSCYLGTIPTHIDKDLTYKVFDIRGAPAVLKECIIAHEIGATGYKHSHAFIKFAPRLEKRNNRHFDVEGQHWHWDYVDANEEAEKKAKMYVCKEDPELREMYLKLACKGKKLGDMSAFVNRIAQCQSRLEAYRSCDNIGEISSVERIWTSREPVMKKRKGPITIEEDLIGWEKNLWIMMKEANRQYEEEESYDDRSVHFIIDQQGGMGKSGFMKWANDYNSRDFLCLSNPMKDSDVAQYLKGSDWEGGVVIMDLQRTVMERNQCMVMIELLRNGFATGGKYQGAKESRDVWFMIVFSNEVLDWRGKLTQDRVKLYLIEDGYHEVPVEVDGKQSIMMLPYGENMNEMKTRMEEEGKTQNEQSQAVKERIGRSTLRRITLADGVALIKKQWGEHAQRDEEKQHVVAPVYP